MKQKQRNIMINPEKTGKHIRELMTGKGLTVRDIQTAMGFSTPQAVYNWIAGKALPSLDNLVILSRTLDASIEDILVIDEEEPGKENDEITDKQLIWEHIRPPPSIDVDTVVDIR